MFFFHSSSLKMTNSFEILFAKRPGVKKIVKPCRPSLKFKTQYQIFLILCLALTVF